MTIIENIQKEFKILNEKNLITFGLFLIPFSNPDYL